MNTCFAARCAALIVSWAVAVSLASRGGGSCWFHGLTCFQVPAPEGPISELSFALWYRPEHAYLFDGKTTYRANISDFTKPVTWLFDPYTTAFAMFGTKTYSTPNGTEALSSIYIDLPTSPPAVINSSYNLIEDSDALLISIRTKNDPFNDTQIMITGLPTLGTLFNYDAASKSIGDPIELEPRFEFIYQWASEVVNFSSEWRDTSGGYAAKQVLGEPDAYPQYGDSLQAWCPAYNNGQRDFIHLRYDREVFVTSVVVYETFAVGNVVGISLLVDEDGGFFPKPTRDIRVDFQGVDGEWVEIDAVRMVGVSLTPAAKINSKGIVAYKPGWKRPSYVDDFKWEASDGSFTVVGTTTLHI
eukprot:m51a1_g688 hypothetical protein (358) ;mRNA; f:326670-329343